MKKRVILIVLILRYTRFYIRFFAGELLLLLQSVQRSVCVVYSGVFTAFFWCKYVVSL
ncbi:hypothetical protein C2G38_2056962 [Gigaspora rosea]|uniref:Uncharacterized protein n=1 Tax=Gigaspora rosea TaxID=44941 RepID=A0A397W6Z2_9GLOM|nr:hypothetical protein C2G38_2056962 [Gigaspora rosea]